jgi:hypothetical protein
VLAFTNGAGPVGAKSMPDETISDPKYWRDRAKRARSKADQVKDPRSKRMLQGLAGAYERLANQAKRRLREAERVQP